MLAAEGRDLGADSLARAYGFIIGGNTVRFLTFGKLDKVIPSKHRDKISNIIARNQMVASIFDEINHNTSKLTGKQKGAFRSSNLMEKSEFVNQAAIVVGMMLDTKVTMKDGSTRNLYEVFNQEGVPSTDIVSYQTKNAKESKPWNADEFFQYAKHVIEETHGDYNHSVKFKGKTLGKLLSTFRTWMYRTTANRYEPEYYDSISGYTRKGKYRSAAGIFQSLPLINKIPVLNKIMPPVVFANSGFDNYMDSLIPKSARKKLGLKDAKKTDGFAEALMSVVKNSGGVYADFFKAILNPLKYKTRFRESLEERGFSEVDTANISSVFTEYLLKVQLGLLAMLMYSLYDEDDDEGVLNGTIIGSMNMLRRFEKDLNFYMDVTETGRTLDNPLAVMRLFNSFNDLVEQTEKAFDGRNPYIQSGLYEGWWRPAKILARNFPGIAAADQVNRYLNLDVMKGTLIEDKEDLYKAFESTLLKDERFED